MYRDRGGVGSSKVGGEMLDRKRINDALDKHLEKSSPSTSRNKGAAVAAVAAAGKGIDHRESRSSSAIVNNSKNKCSDGHFVL